MRAKRFRPTNERLRVRADSHGFSAGYSDTHVRVTKEIRTVRLRAAFRTSNQLHVDFLHLATNLSSYSGKSMFANRRIDRSRVVERVDHADVGGGLNVTTISSIGRASMERPTDERKSRTSESWSTDERSKETKAANKDAVRTANKRKSRLRSFRSCVARTGVSRSQLCRVLSSRVIVDAVDFPRCDSRGN